MGRYSQGSLIVSSSPHVLDTRNTRTIMLDVIIALMPAFIMSGVVFGERAIMLNVVCMVSCVFFEWAYQKITKLESTIGDLSAVVTGMLLSFNLPSSLPYWMAVIGCFVAIVIVKQLFGGIGQNFVNPAITARIVLMMSFATPMTTWPVPRQMMDEESLKLADAVTAPTPLGILNMGGDVSAIPSNMDMFLGFCGGCLGETSAAALLLGGIYLVARKVIHPSTPIAFIATVALFALAAGQDPVFHMFAGGVFLGAIFMATDYVTTPLTVKGKIVFGIGCGLLTMTIRLFGSLPEGVSFSILIMNILTPHIDSLTMNKPYGGVPKNE